MPAVALRISVPCRGVSDYARSVFWERSASNRLPQFGQIISSKSIRWHSISRLHLGQTKLSESRSFRRSILSTFRARTNRIAIEKAARNLSQESRGFRIWANLSPAKLMHANKCPNKRRPRTAIRFLKGSLISSELKPGDNSQNDAQPALPLIDKVGTNKVRIETSCPVF